MKITILITALLFAVPSFLTAQNAGKINSPVPLPIHAWIGPPANQTNYPRYKELADAGFTHSFSGFPNTEAMTKALNIAKVAGIKLFINIPELHSDPEGTVKRFKDHPATAGYHLRDEPKTSMFGDLAAWARRIRAVDDDHFCYINLFPNYATPEQLGSPSYQEHVDEFIKTVPVKVLSFDHYPITTEGIRPEYYENLKIISEAAKKAGKPFWAFALAVAHGPYPIPSPAHLRHQVYCNLAYGAQGIQYFTYWTPESTRWDFHDGPIGIDGRRTVVYDRVKALNKELRALSGVFVGSRILSVGHSGYVMPKGATPFETRLPFEEISTGGFEGVVSWFETNGRKYLMVVNGDMVNSMPLNVILQRGHKADRVLKDGRLSNVNGSDIVMVGAGDAMLFTWLESK